ncbi:hypothetical protein LDENG_00071370 [Lucifuga dentata]|nr:hypothetical protein LDENG_00071370 [Lucifuga dentata]
MEAEDPHTLCDLCLAQVCRSLDSLCSKQPDGSLCLRWAPVLPQEVADQLLCKMADQGILNDTTVGIFRSCKALRLRRASIRCCPLSADAFRLALCPHRLQELDASWVSWGLTGASIISGLVFNTDCRSSLQKLSLNGLHLDWESLGDDGGVHVGFSSLRGLRTLSLAYTDLTDDVLEDICSLPQLESLDISCTAVSKLTALLECRNTLKSLIAHRLQELDMPPAMLLFVLSQLHTLRHLDFSDDHFAVDDSDGNDGDEMVRQLLEGSPKVLPALVSLDVSGRKRITEAAVRSFVEARSELIFLGLVATGVSACDILSSRNNLKVTGEANESQVCEALRRYSERECFIREALTHLHDLTTDRDQPRPELLSLVLSGMKSQLTSLNVQLLATACVFNLTTEDLAETMPVSLLSSTITQLLCTMKMFPNHYLLSIEGIEQLGKDITIMKQLLGFVQQRAMDGVVDSPLKFALRALWNLTESLTAAHHFIQCQGLELYEEVLESYHGESSIQLTVLGLLNNIAEVEELQGGLMEEDLLEHILSLLQDSQVQLEVRYVAGGILAQLTSRPETWSLEDELRTTIVKQLTSQPLGVQLWAVWAIHLACRENIAHYKSMLQMEGIVDLLEALAAHPDTHSDVKGLTESILRMVDQHHMETFNSQQRPSSA